MNNGKRTYKYYYTKEEALVQLDKIKGNRFLGLAPDVAAEAVICLQKLDGKATLSEAVEFFLKNAITDTEAPVISVAAKRFVEWLEESGRSKAHTRTVRIHLQAFVERFGDKVPSVVSTLRMSEWIKELSADTKHSARTKLNRIGAAKNFLGWAKTQGWINAVPSVDERLLPRKEIKEPEIYTAEEAKSFFALLEEKFPQAIPHFAVRAFLGLRTSEAERLMWDDIDMENKMLRVRAKKSKLGIARTLDEDLAPTTAFVWLNAYREIGVFSIGNYLPEKIAKVFPMKKNAFRKTFATMLTSLRKNQQETMYATGHTSLSTLKTHYAGAKQAKSEAEAYFAILPQR
ncbi:MAG: hypothetical protein IJX22_04300, partial [Opitutales bacterium]|nr:hypothetical protein [Opitutales bacterium]